MGQPFGTTGFPRRPVAPVPEALISLGVMSRVPNGQSSHYPGVAQKEKWVRPKVLTH